jgi:high-affinity iron transporter
MWDTSALIDDSSRGGGLLAAFTGYRARPSLLVMIVLAVYGVSVVLMLRRASQPSSKP